MNAWLPGHRAGFRAHAKPAVIGLLLRENGSQQEATGSAAMWVRPPGGTDIGQRQNAGADESRVYSKQR